MINTYKGLRRVWHADTWADDGRLVCGSGITESQAKSDCQRKLNAINTFLALPIEEQLRSITSQKDILSDDLQRCVKLIAQILLKDEA